jgi:glycosyltransferase involved in cell wall biosynthesis
MPGKKKVCFVSLFAYGIFNPEANLKFGGSETQMYFLADKLAKNSDFEVDFIVLDIGQADVETYGAVKVIKAYKRGGGIANMLGGFLKMVSVLMKSNPEIIICRAFGREVGVSALYAKIFGKKLIYSLANDQDAGGRFFSGLSGKIFQFGFMMADWYVAQSQFQAGEIKKISKKKGDKVIIIKNSWPDEVLAPAERDSILWVGSSADLKRPEIFLDLAAAFPQENFVMVMARSKQSERRWEELYARAKSIGNLRLIESIPFKEINFYFSKAKVLVSTSSSEGFPNVFLQAALAKTPILSLVIDPDNFIADNDAGIVCGGDYEKLKEGLKMLLSQDEARTRKGENLYRYFKVEHVLDKNVKKWEELLSVL